MKKILLTGAAGGIGQVVRTGLCGQYSLLRCLDIAKQVPASEGEETVACDLADINGLENAMKGIDCVVHLAGVPTEDNWQNIVAANIEGCYNTFDTAWRMGVKRFIFASSNHAVGYHRRARFIDNSALPRPDSRYGVSKVFGEALGRMYADKHGMQVACLRIGSFRIANKPEDFRQLNTWISHRDMVHLVKCCIDHPGFHYEIIYGVSNNLRNRWDNSNVAHLGYLPQDNAENYLEQVLALNSKEDSVSVQFHGAMYCGLEFTGNTDKIS